MFGCSSSGEAEKEALVHENRSCAHALLFLFLVGLTSVSEGSEKRYHWWVVNIEMSEKHNSLSIENTSQNIKLRGGWSRHISKVSVNGARVTSCVKGAEQVEFSVMCDRRRPKDHVQIRFRNSSTNEYIDFIEVGCKP